MKTSDFLRQHDACSSGSRWALSVSKDMADVWDALVDQGKHEWLFWVVTRPGVFSESVLRKTACRFVRETPLRDGRTVWDLLTDDRSQKAVEVSEAYADGKATKAELADAYSAARAASATAWAAIAAADADAHAERADFFAAHAAYSPAYAAAIAASNAARAADAARAAADADLDGAFYTAHDAARTAQVQMIAELGNPFKK